jgi:hypothetical protein
MIGLYFVVHITHWSESRRTHNHVLLSHLRLGSIFVPSYDSQAYSEGILTHLHTGGSVACNGASITFAFRVNIEFRLSHDIREAEFCNASVV